MSNKTIFLNMRTSEGVETVDEFTRGEDSPNDPREFRQYVTAMIREYHMTGQPVYRSSRPTRAWANK